MNKIRNKNRVKVGQKLNVPLKGGQTWGNRDNGGPPGYTKRIYITFSIATALKYI